jgi:uncharacterized caspase-like protein
MWGFGWLGAIAIVVIAAAAAPVHAEPRVALVIGNAHYNTKGIPALETTIADANLIGATLKKAGFEVLVANDLDQKHMKAAIAKVGDVLAAAGPKATGLFFFAGHGVQVHSGSYLIPLKAEIAREVDVDLESIALDNIFNQIAFAGCATSIVIIDASRNNPLAREFRGGGGMAELTNWSPGLFVGYSAAPGTVAIEGKGPNSPFVTALAGAMLTPGVDISEVFRTVRRAVLEETQSRQMTWDGSTLAEPFYFMPQK